jgi:hypothetical protein
MLLDKLMTYGILTIKDYKVCLVQNNRVVEVWNKSGEKVLSKPSSWAVFWVVGEMIGVKF